MNKYEELFEEILQKTREGDLKWKQLRKTSNSDVIISVNLVWRQFETELERNEQNFTILLVEKKYEDPDLDFAYEKYAPELLVLLDNELVTTIDDSTVSRSKLISLVSAVESRSDRAKKLFGA
ncbi:MAG: hypothetical protein KDJ54_19465 [Candidatus Competibacteraceae bacterium]|nr:hypothetical protein [Candidatus Competibacteraceae bacterium]